MRNKVLLGLIVVILISSVVIQTPQATLTDPAEVNALVLLGHAFGWSFFEIQDVLEDWGCDITITGLTSRIQSCLNREDRSLDADILVSDIDQNDLGQYDILIVPSGGHWHDLIANESALNLIQMAYDEGLFISGICIGVTPIAAANVTEGHVVAGHNLCYPYVDNSGGTLLPLLRVVSDGQLITGDNGDGPPTGYEGAPHYDLCVAILKSLMGYSYFEDMSVQSVLEGNDTVYYMNVTTSGQVHLFDDVTTTEITEVTALLHTADNKTVIAEVDLSDSNSDSVFLGNITGLQEDDYVVDLMIQDANISMEFVRDALSFTAENLTTTSSTTTIGVGDGILTVETIAITGAVTVVFVVLIVVWRRKSGP